MAGPPRPAPLFFAYVLTGAITVLLAPLLPALSARLHLSDAASGRLFAAQFLSSAAGSVALSLLARRCPVPRLLAGAYGSMAVALLALPFAPAALLPWCVALYAFPLGLTNPAVSLLAPAASTLNLLNVCWSLGAVVCPPLAGLLIARCAEPAPAVLLAALCALAALLCLPLAARAPEPPRSAPTARLPLAPALATAAFLFFYVGAESALSGWLPTHALRHATRHPALAGFALSLFWLAIMAGRLYAGLRPEAAPRRTLLGGIALAAAGAGLLVAAPNLAGLACGAALAGFGLAPLFPTRVALFQQQAPQAAPRLLGPIFAGGALGGVVFPWLIGVLSAASGSLSLGLLVCLVALSALAVLAVAQR